MTAQWISDGSEIPAVALKPPPSRLVFRVGRFEFTRTPRMGRWSCQPWGEPGVREDGQVMAGTLPAVGVAGARTPLGAFLSVLRMLRKN